MLNQNEVCHGFNIASLTYDDAAVMQKKVAHRMIDLLANWECYSKIFDKTFNEYEILRECHAIEFYKRKILEIGCGTGLLTTNLIPILPKKSAITLVDIAPAMLESCKNKLEKSTLYKNQHDYSFICSDIEVWDLENRHFDLTISSMTLQWIKEIKIMLQKLLESSILLVFNIPLYGSLKQWYDLCNKIGLVHKKANFIDENDLYSYLKSLNQKKFCDQNIMFHKEIIEVHYESALDFALHFKKIGATSGFNHVHFSNIIKYRHLLQMHKNFTAEYIIGYFFISNL